MRKERNHYTGEEKVAILRRHLLDKVPVSDLSATIRGGVYSLMAEILEDHIQLHLMHPGRGKQTPVELTEDLIGLVRAYLK